MLHSTESLEVACYPAVAPEDKPNPAFTKRRLCLFTTSRLHVLCVVTALKDYCAAGQWDVDVS
jgi:hypothetical protein